MSLNFTIPTKRIPMPTAENPDNGFDVRGLSTDDLVYLIGKYFADLKDLYDPKQPKPDFNLFAAKLQKQAPEALAEAIAIAADAKDQVELFRRLPTAISYITVSEIGALTFGEEGGLESFLGMMASVLGATTNVMREVQKIATDAQLVAMMANTDSLPGANN